MKLYETIERGGKEIFTIKIPVSLTAVDVHNPDWDKLKENLLDNIKLSYELALDGLREDLTKDAEV